MATLLYKLGIFSARRALLVLGAWLLIIASAAALALSLGGKFTTTISIDGVPSQQVIDQLQESFPDASRASGQVVFHNPNSSFSSADQDAITAALADVEKLPGVSEALNPFTIQQEIEQGIADLADGKQKLLDGEKEIADGEKEIADGEKKVEAGLEDLRVARADLRQKLDQVNDGLRQLELAGAPEEAKAELLANRAQLQGGLAEIRRQQAIAEASLQDLEQAKLDIADAKAEIEQAKVDIATGEKLLAATAEFTTVSDDGTVALATIRFDKRGSELEVGIRESVVEALSEANLGDVEVEFSQELTQSYGEILGIGEIIGLVSAAVVLYILLGTLIGVALPIFSAVIGVGISASVVLALASEVELTSTTPVLGVMLGLAVGIDYSLFIVNRHRRQLKGGMDVRESIGLANGTSGNAVLFAGLTVVIALVALNLTGIAFIGLMGTMGGVAISRNSPSMRMRTR